MAGRIDQLGDAVRSVIRAFHGTPHDFDKFDASKIGTGEGAQSYGHGLYFASNEDVAKSYRDTLSDRRAVLVGGEDASDLYDAIKDGPLYGTPRSPESEAMRAIAGSGYRADSADDVLKNARIILSDNADRAKIDANLRALEALAARGITVKEQPGRMYEVEIAHPESALLDLDSPASGYHKEALLRSAFEAPDNKWQKMAIEDIASPDTPASSAVQSLLRAYNSITDNPMASRRDSAARVSDLLLKNGIPGSKYLDNWSRATGVGTRNYVMFPGTEDSIRILRKYAIPGAIATGAASEVISDKRPSTPLVDRL